MSVEHVLKVTHLFYNKIKAECVFWLICILVAANVVRSAVLLLFSAFFCAVSLIVFHTKALNDLRWIENNEKQNQGWSFFILIPAILCFIISGVTTVMAARRFRRDDSDGPVAIPYRSWADGQYGAVSFHCHRLVGSHDIHGTTAPPSARSSSRSSYSCRIPVFIFACWLESPGYVWVFKGSANTN